MEAPKNLTRREAFSKLGKLSLLATLSERGPAVLPADVIPASSSSDEQSQSSTRRISLQNVTIAVDHAEPSFVQYGVKELAEYLAELTRNLVPVASSLDNRLRSLVVVGKALCEEVQSGLWQGRDLGEEGFLLRSTDNGGKSRILVSGTTPQGTNAGLANLMRLIRVQDGMPCVEADLDVQSSPRFAFRGIHLNGWPIDFPTAFRAWREKDWRRFIDLVWTLGANLFLLWPGNETLPIPHSTEDAAYLQEVRRVVDYAQEQRGIRVWIMHSANRIATSDCRVREPKLRPYWVDACQADMNPADPVQFERIAQSHEALYRIVNNADGYCMIDSDPGGWPQSPLSDQMKIFKRARALLDQYHLEGAKAKLIDWMWVGWGRHKFFNSAQTVIGQYDWTDKNPDASDLAFMAETIRNFQQNLPEPWWLIPGFPQYLETCRNAGLLGKTVYLPYGAIEFEPAFPATNVPLDSVRNVLETLKKFPETRGIMGNNQTPLVQLPRTYYFLRSAWDYDYRNRPEREVLLELSESLYPGEPQLITECFSALISTEPRAIEDVLHRLCVFIDSSYPSRKGVLGRKLFPDHLVIARNLAFQLEIRASLQRLLHALQGKPTREACSMLVESYLQALLAWNKETGWERMISLGLWRSAIYSSDKDFSQALSTLKRVLAEPAHTLSYAAVAAFFAPITQRLLAKYEQDAVMIGCIEPLKLALIQSP